ncbi:MAG: glutamine--fructose-6-phosphate transaminase (isomerizing) [Nanoarchaeota archaeon]|nr:glutamine--fructose-6-phosphate transaminase (isomerizing) [Nanoarchaeota archaeon]MBU4242301.1 glutamine--fructose-6-phosphate transaminase (isomerizing) [Nanoarchaeota archaeon]MBU4456151.1 glutamine--fructose-6-phosphate transaminase (isomerizing) [Nanoarchaeota archaeon]MCG2719217.1 glutamine--fructose-6-phosphate transaminase (isomerizing) [Nanoarchaeota archaeon]
MCGIIGYKGDKLAVPIVLKGLKSLEYRGYDSWGIATKSNSEIIVNKAIGKIGEVEIKDIMSENIAGSVIAVGHTRWATHGNVTKINAHPHLSQNLSIAVVHNGIIENYLELKKMLKAKNIIFNSKTDSEVIPKLIEYYQSAGKNFRNAFTETLRKLHGNFAIVAINNSDDEIWFGKRGSPLVLGLGQDEFFVASDVPAFLEYTNKVIYLDDDQYGKISDNIEIFQLKDNVSVPKQVQTVEWDIAQAQKGDFPHFMIKEINEQKNSIKQAIGQNSGVIENVISLLKDAFGIFFVGCGTSYHACVSASYNFSHIAHKHINVVLASEFRNYEEFLTEKTLMVAVSQSGETADLIDAVNIAKKNGVKVISIVNVMGSTLQRLSDISIMMNAGPEICVCSTKSYTSQLAILLLLAYGVAGDLESGKLLIKKTASYVEQVISENIEIAKSLAKKIKDEKSCFLIGRDLANPSALEGALKIKEVSYIHAEGFAAGELKHGAIALIEQGTPLIAFVTQEVKQLTLSNTEEVKSRGGFIIGVSTEPCDTFDVFFNVPDVGQANPLLMIIPIQLLSYFLAIEKGLDPDKPRNLAKSVTVR